MWNAFGNGSSGYVSKAQGWEFVPCSRLERPGKKLQSPASVRSFPSHLLELPPGPAAITAASDATGAQTPNQQPHTRIKKKLEELKKRFDQEKEEWRMEKEMLLRQVADIQVQTDACVRKLSGFDQTTVCNKMPTSSILFCVVFAGWREQEDAVGSEVCFRGGAVGGEA